MKLAPIRVKGVLNSWLAELKNDVFAASSCANCLRFVTLVSMHRRIIFLKYRLGFLDFSFSTKCGGQGGVERHVHQANPRLVF